MSVHERGSLSIPIRRKVSLSIMAENVGHSITATEKEAEG